MLLSIHYKKRYVLPAVFDSQILQNAPWKIDYILTQIALFYPNLRHYPQEAKDWP